MRGRCTLVSLVVLLAIALLAACGGNDSGGSSDGGSASTVDGGSDGGASDGGSGGTPSCRSVTSAASCSTGQFGYTTTHTLSISSTNQLLTVDGASCTFVKAENLTGWTSDVKCADDYTCGGSSERIQWHESSLNGAQWSIDGALGNWWVTCSGGGGGGGGGTGCAGKCSNCLDSCRGFSSCCCGSGCMCESSCTPGCGDNC